MKISRRKPLSELGEESVTVTFGPGSDPEKYQLNLIEEAFKRKIIILEDYNGLEFEYGHRLEETPYSEVGYARKLMSLLY